MGTYIDTLRKIWLLADCPMSLQTESWVFALLAFDWLTCTVDQRSLGLQTTSKEPQVFISQD